MKRILLAFVGMSAIGGLGTASAADLPRQQYYKAPPAYIAPINNWTGFYLGLNGGGGWGESKWSWPGGSDKFDLSGGMVGGTVGYNWQAGNWVLGLEGDADWANIRGSECFAGGCISTKNDFLSTIRGRVGYSFGQWLPYVTGGAAIGSVKAGTNWGEVSDTNVGWTAGVGIEYAFARNWSAKVEYLHVDLGKMDCSVGSGCWQHLGADKISYTSDLVRGGVNFRF